MIGIIISENDDNCGPPLSNLICIQWVEYGFIIEVDTLDN